MANNKDKYIKDLEKFRDKYIDKSGRSPLNSWESKASQEIYQTISDLKYRIKQLKV